MPACTCDANPRLVRSQRQDAGSTALNGLSAVHEPRHLLRTRLLRVIIAFAAVYLIWGSTFLGIRIAIQTIPPGIMAGMRWSIAGALFYGALRWRGAPPPSARDWRTAALIGGGIIFGGNGTVTYAERFIPSGTVAVIVAVVPAMMALLGWLSGITARPRLPVWLGIARATWGVVVIARP